MSARGGSRWLVGSGSTPPRAGGPDMTGGAECCRGTTAPEVGSAARRRPVLVG
ncbi:hypothetical protein ACFQX7_13475 [Luedemannella flava]